MVDIDNKKEVDIVSNAVYGLFRILERMIEIRNVNYPQIENKVILAMWHHDQCSLHGIPFEKRKNVNILISKSGDGEVIARVVQKWGFSTVRGSKDIGAYYAKHEEIRPGSYGKASKRVRRICQGRERGLRKVCQRERNGMG